MTLNEMEVEKRIYELADTFFKKIRDDRNKTDLVQMYSANSIDSIEFLLIIEDEYTMEFDDEELNMHTLMDIHGLAKLILQKAG